MPVLFKIKEEQYQFPEGYQDTTLKKYLASFEAYTKPKELKEHEQETTEEGVRKSFNEKIVPNYGKIALFYIDFVSFWTGLDKDFLKSVEGKTVSLNDWDGENKKTLDGWMWVESLYIQIRDRFAKSLVKASKDISDTIEHAGRLYYLPTKYLKKSNVNEFIEMQNAEHVAKVVHKDQRKAIPQILCALLKSKKDAPYDPRQMEREKLFLSMTMDKVMRVSFFLSKLNEKFLQDSLICMALLRLSQQPHNVAQA